MADTGIGIPPEHHETIFQEFSQVENPLQERHRGTGLGLPLCRNLAMLLGGRMWLESELGKGSRFFVEIPRFYVRRVHQLVVTCRSCRQPEFHRSPVLILEDNLEAASEFESHLRQSEFQAIIVSEVSQAQTWIARHVPVAIVANVYIGEESIWGFVIETRDKLPTVPLIATSDHDEGQRALAKGANLFLVKACGTRHAAEGVAPVDFSQCALSPPDRRRQ